MSAIRYCGCPKCDAVFKLPTETHSQSAETARCGECHAAFDVTTNLMKKTDAGFIATRSNRGLHKGIVSQFTTHHKNDNSHNNNNNKGDNNEGTEQFRSSKRSEQDKNALQEICIDEANPFTDNMPRSPNIHEEFEFVDKGGYTEPSYVSASLSTSALPEHDSNGVTKHKVAHYIIDRTNPLMIFICLIAVIGFVLLLGVQVKHFLVPKYAQDATYRQYLIGFCQIANCELAPLQNPFLFVLTHTRIDLHPTEPGALRVTVKAVNQAEFAQPYPHVQLTLTDRGGRIVGRRTFSPNLYLPKGADNILAQGQLALIILDLARPHDKAVGFIVDIVSEPAAS